MTIAFCCTGNTCRSPMAEQIFKNILKNNNVNGVEVISFGVRCSDGISISKNSLMALNNLNIVGKITYSQSVNQKILEKCEYIFTMTEEHSQFLKKYFQTKGVVSSIGEFVGGDDVCDPYLGSVDAYIACANQIKEMLETLYLKLKKEFRHNIG